MSPDIPSHAFLRVETGYGACTHQYAGAWHARSSVWEESGRETAWPGLAFTSLLSGYGRSITLLRTKKPTTAFVFWPRLEIHVGSGPD